MPNLLSNFQGWLLGILYTLPALVIGFTLHEYCHAAVAVLLGDPTPRMEGRLTLNPSAHIDWIGMLLFLLLGWGWARPVHIQPGNLKGRRWGEAAVSAAGPLSNFLLAMLCYVVTILLPQGVWMQFLLYGVSVNLTLCFLNLLPVPPLDGFAVLRALLGLRAGKVLDFMQKYGLILVLLLLLLGVLNSYLFLMRGLSIALFVRLFG